MNSAYPDRSSSHAVLAWPLARTLLMLVGGVAILTASSRIQVPWYPVPMTLQTLAVPLLGAFLGWRLGLATVLSWLALAAWGAPVLAGQHTGLAAFTGPTAGYLAAFPVTVVLTGLLVSRGWNGHRPAFAFAGMLLANAICLGGGFLWLSTLIGIDRAFNVGVLPFLSGGLFKSGLAASVLVMLKPGIADRSVDRGPGSSRTLS